MTRLLKSTVALVAALGLLAGLATPSPAGPITGGSMTVPAMAPPITAPFGGCTSSSISGTDTSTGVWGASTPVSGTAAMTLHSAFAYQGANWVFSATGTGTYTSAHVSTQAPIATYSITVHLNLTAQIRQASATDPCASTGTSKCTFIGLTSLTLVGTAQLTHVHPTPSGAVTLTGSRAISAFGCTAPFSALNGKTANFSLTGTL